MVLPADADVNAVGALSDFPSRWTTHAAPRPSADTTVGRTAEVAFQFEFLVLLIFLEVGHARTILGAMVVFSEIFFETREAIQRSITATLTGRGTLGGCEYAPNQQQKHNQRASLLRHLTYD